PDDATQDPARRGANDRALELVSTRCRAKHRARCGADDRITLGISNRLRRLPRIRTGRARGPRYTARAAPSGCRRWIRRSRYRLDLLRIAVRGVGGWIRVRSR